MSLNKGRQVRRLLFGLGLLLAVGLLVSWVVGGQLLSVPRRHVGDPPAGWGIQDVSIPSSSGSELAGWHLVAEGKRGVVVLLHGIGGSRRDLLGRAQLLREAGYSSLMIDFRGHGESTGEGTSLGYAERHDVRAAVEYASAAHWDEPLAVLGLSMGAAAALMESPMEVDALVLESVFPSLESAIRHRVEAHLGPLAGLPSELLLIQVPWRLGFECADLRPIDRMLDVACPLLMMAGTLDHGTPPEETRQMFEQALEPKRLWLAEGVGHEDLQRARPMEYKRQLLEFLERHLGK